MNEVNVSETRELSSKIIRKAKAGKIELTAERSTENHLRAKVKDGGWISVKVNDCIVAIPQPESQVTLNGYNWLTEN